MAVVAMRQLQVMAVATAAAKATLSLNKVLNYKVLILIADTAGL